MHRTTRAATLCPRLPRARRAQRGVYALEWAIVFLVFFALLYGSLSFALGFLVREAMQAAAEDGARAALQYQSARMARKEQARRVVQQKLDWLPTALKSVLSDDDHFSFQLCRAGDAASCTPDMTPSALRCDVDANAPCVVQLRISLPYGQHPFTPSVTLGLMELAMPDLHAQAQILVDQQGF